MRFFLVARHFPPAVSGGARRPFLLANTLKDFGFEVHVIAPDLPAGFSGTRVPHPNQDPAEIFDPRAITVSLRSIAREWARWPDPDIAWARQAAHALLDQNPTPQDWVLTTSPPESIHHAGYVAKRRTGVNWIADLRDAWLTPPLRPVRRNPVRRLLEAGVASRWLNEADLILAVAPFIAEEAASFSKAPVKVLPHFAPEIQALGRMEPDTQVHLVHTGSFTYSDPGRTIEPVMAAFEAARQHRDDLQLHLAGRLSGAEVERVEGSPEHRAITLHGVIDYPSSLELQAQADALLITAAPDANNPPGKAAEYVAIGKPIIACGRGPWRSLLNAVNSDQDRSEIDALKDIKIGDTTPPNDVFGAKDAAKLVLGWVSDLNAQGQSLKD